MIIMLIRSFDNHLLGLISTFRRLVTEGNIRKTSNDFSRFPSGNSLLKCILKVYFNWGIVISILLYRCIAISKY